MNQLTEYQRELVELHMSVIDSVIRGRIKVRGCALLSYEDFYQIGCEALCRAALAYQPELGEFEPLGNGSAMRVSSVAWLRNSLDTVRHAAALSASVSHNHPEGVKGAEAVASAIFLARTGSSKAEIKKYIVKEFGYDLSRTCDEIRPGYHMDETC